MKLNWTQISNEFIDSMSNFTGEEVKIFTAISRKTIGWHKTSDRISYSQLKEMTGIKHHITLKKGIDKLVSGGWITKRRTSIGYFYDLDLLQEVKSECHGMTQGVSRDDTGAMSRDDTTKETLNKETIQNKKDMSESQRDAIPETNSWKLFIAHYYKIYKELTGGEPVLVNIDFHNLKFIAIPLKNKDNWQEILKLAMENCYKKSEKTKGEKYEVRFETTELYKHFSEYCRKEDKYAGWKK